MIGQMQSPPEVTEGLRRIDPAAELVHLGGAEWLLGVRAENGAARERVRTRLEEVTDKIGDTAHLDVATRAYVDVELSKELELLNYYAETGFRPIQLYDKREVSWGEIIEDFRLRDFNLRTRREAAVREMKEAASFEEADRWRDEVLVDFMETEGLGIYDRVFRGAKHFLQRVTPPWLRN